jgi:hypothetical protein
VKPWRLELAGQSGTTFFTSVFASMNYRILLCKSFESEEYIVSYKGHRLTLRRLGRLSMHHTMNVAIPNEFPLLGHKDS